MPKGKGGDRVFLQNAVKTLAANIRFASVDKPVRSIVVTSSVPNEGKSFVAVELARALAEGGRSVLLVECDMRRRTLAATMGVHARHGIYALLAGQVTLDDAVVSASARGLWFLDCEPHIPSPVDILSSRRFSNFVSQAIESFDYVIFDTPPLSAFVDASVISTVVDGTLLVVRENFVKREELVAAYEQLQKANAHVIGAVMNFCDTEKSEYYYSYYAKGEKKAVSAEYNAPTAPVRQAAPAQQAPVQAAPSQQPAPQQRPAAQAAAAPVQRPAAQPAQVAQQPVSNLRPIPEVQPDSTEQFLIGTSYRPRAYEDE